MAFTPNLFPYFVTSTLIFLLIATMLLRLNRWNSSSSPKYFYIIMDSNLAYSYMPVRLLSIGLCPKHRKCFRPCFCAPKVLALAANDDFSVPWRLLFCWQSNARSCSRSFICIQRDPIWVSVLSCSDVWPPKFASWESHWLAYSLNCLFWRTSSTNWCLRVEWCCWAVQHSSKFCLPWKRWQWRGSSWSGVAACRLYLGRWQTAGAGWRLPFLPSPTS